MRLKKNLISIVFLVIVLSYSTSLGAYFYGYFVAFDENLASFACPTNFIDLDLNLSNPRIEIPFYYENSNSVDIFEFQLGVKLDLIYYNDSNTLLREQVFQGYNNYGVIKANSYLATLFTGDINAFSEDGLVSFWSDANLSKGVSHFVDINLKGFDLSKLAVFDFYIFDFNITEHLS